MKRRILPALEKFPGLTGTKESIQTLKTLVKQIQGSESLNHCQFRNVDKKTKFYSISGSERLLLGYYF